MSQQHKRAEQIYTRDDQKTVIQPTNTAPYQYEHSLDIIKEIWSENMEI